MTAKRKAPRDVDEYISGFPKDVQKKLEQIRATIRKAVPHADETISYQIPTFTLNGNLIYFAAYEKHISVYPAPRESPEFKAELADYAGGKGTVQFPLDRPIPFDLITRIVKFRVKANLAKTAARKKR
jgi:uncharacterized protein YdhG (YjbR/CyaY superfamily)